jgi:hypothetical protein
MDANAVVWVTNLTTGTSVKFELELNGRLPYSRRLTTCETLVMEVNSTVSANATIVDVCNEVIKSRTSLFLSPQEYPNFWSNVQYHPSQDVYFLPTMYGQFPGYMGLQSLNVTSGEFSTPISYEQPFSTPYFMLSALDPAGNIFYSLATDTDVSPGSVWLFAIDIVARKPHSMVADPRLNNVAVGGQLFWDPVGNRLLGFNSVSRAIVVINTATGKVDEILSVYPADTEAVTMYSFVGTNEWWYLPVNKGNPRSNYLADSLFNPAKKTILFPPRGPPTNTLFDSGAANI